MRHRKSGVKLSRTSSHRTAMFRNMVTSLFKYERIQTTDTKAKELRRWADDIITLAKRGDLHARRQVLAIIREKDVVHNLFEKVQEKFGDRAGGYTRIVKVGPRPGDAAPISLIELIAKEGAEQKKKAKTKKKAEAPKPGRDQAETRDEKSEAKAPQESAQNEASASQEEAQSVQPSEEPAPEEVPKEKED